MPWLKAHRLALILQSQSLSSTTTANSGKVAEVTGTFEKVDKYGRNKEMAYQLELRYGRLTTEWAVVGTTQAKAAGQATGAMRRCTFLTRSKWLISSPSLTIR